MRTESCQSQLPEANVATQILSLSVGRPIGTVASWSAGNLKRAKIYLICYSGVNTLTAREPARRYQAEAQARLVPTQQT